MEYITLEKLEVYQLARNLSRVGWSIYQPLDWRTKKIVGDQFIESTDSVGANIAEGYSRVHFFEKIKFYYNSRASLAESNNHWVELMCERKQAPQDKYELYKDISRRLEVKINNFITATYHAKKHESKKKDN